MFAPLTDSGVHVHHVHGTLYRNPCMLCSQTVAFMCILYMARFDIAFITIHAATVGDIFGGALVGAVCVGGAGGGWGGGLC